MLPFLPFAFCTNEYVHIVGVVWYTQWKREQQWHTTSRTLISHIATAATATTTTTTAAATAAGGNIRIN
jgi:hypothetical protein